MSGCEAGIGAIMPYESGARANLEAPVVFQDGELLRAGDGVVAMCNHEYGSVTRQALQRVPDQHLALRVQARSRRVEDKQRRILEERAGDSDALGLAGAQARTLLTDLGIIALWEPGNKFSRSGEFSGLFNLAVACNVAGQADIGADAALEQHHPLPAPTPHIPP